MSCRPRRKRRPDGIVHTQILVVLSNGLYQSALVLGKESEFLDEVQQPRRLTEPANHHFQRNPPGLSSRSIRFHSVNRSQSAASEPTRLSLPFEAIISALYQNRAGIPFCRCL